MYAIIDECVERGQRRAAGDLQALMPPSTRRAIGVVRLVEAQESDPGGDIFGGRQVAQWNRIGELLRAAFGIGVNVVVGGLFERAGADAVAADPVATVVLADVAIEAEQGVLAGEIRHIGRAAAHGGD